MTDYADLIAQTRKASTAVYLVAPEAIAADLSAGFKACADALEALTDEVEDWKLGSQVEADAADEARAELARLTAVPDNLPPGTVADRIFITPPVDLAGNVDVFGPSAVFSLSFSAEVIRRFGYTVPAAPPAAVECGFSWPPSPGQTTDHSCELDAGHDGPHSCCSGAAVCPPPAPALHVGGKARSWDPNEGVVTVLAIDPDTSEVAVQFDDGSLTIAGVDELTPLPGDEDPAS